jgi:hypothetical protein
MVSPKSTERMPVLTAPCKCHALDAADWPEKDASIQVALCMRWCPCCAQEFRRWDDLQLHLNGAKYRARGLKMIFRFKTMPPPQANVSK